MLDTFQVVYVLLLAQCLDFYIIPDFDREMTWSRAITQILLSMCTFLQSEVIIIHGKTEVYNSTGFLLTLSPLYWLLSMTATFTSVAC